MHYIICRLVLHLKWGYACCWIHSSFVSSLYSGTLVHILHGSLKGGQVAEALLGEAPLSWQLYCTLLVAVRNRSGKPQPAATTQERTRGGRHQGRGRGRGRGNGVGRGRGRGGREAKSVMRMEDVSNRFALLMNSDWWECSSNCTLASSVFLLQHIAKMFTHVYCNFALS